MAQDTVIKGTDEPVVFEFDFSDSPEFAEGGLDNFTYIEVSLCSETYSTLSDPSNLYTQDLNLLVLKIGGVTELDDGKYTPIIVGYNNQNYINGKPLNMICKNRLGSPVKVC